MKYLADTVTIIRHFSQSGKIGQQARQVLLRVENGEAVLCISVVSLFEILYLSERNRIPIDLATTLKHIQESTNCVILDLSAVIIQAAQPLAGLELHDRLIVATALHHDTPILTSDSDITNSRFINVIW
jgi:PIN domain nuclease of toxin-antitoxin system